MQTPEAKALFENLLLQVGTTSERDNFLDLIRRIESDNRLMASPDDTSAKGVYQFTDDSVETAKNRAITMGFDKGIINLIPNNPQQWTDDEADILTLSNLFAAVKATLEWYHSVDFTTLLISFIFTKSSKFI